MGAAGTAIGLVDTDVLIEAARGIWDAKAFLNDQRISGGIHISAVSAMELLVGCRDAAALTRTQQFLSQAIEVPLTPAATWIARQLMLKFHLSHGLLIPDALIVATALEHGLPLFTRNIRHFRAIPDLVAAAPY